MISTNNGHVPRRQHRRLVRANRLCLFYLITVFVHTLLWPCAPALAQVDPWGGAGSDSNEHERVKAPWPGEETGFPTISHGTNAGEHDAPFPNRDNPPRQSNPTPRYDYRTPAYGNRHPTYPPAGYGPGGYSPHGYPGYYDPRHNPYGPRPQRRSMSTPWPFW